MSAASSSEILSKDLLVAGKVLGIYCSRQNIDWLRCKAEDPTNLPGSCLAQGAQVQACADEVLSLLLTKCKPEFSALAHCVNDLNNPNGLDNCRKEEEQFYKNCLLGSIKVELRAAVPDTPRETLQDRLYSRYGKRFGEKDPRSRR